MKKGFIELIAYRHFKEIEHFPLYDTLVLKMRSLACLYHHLALNCQLNFECLILLAM